MGWDAEALRVSLLRCGSARLRMRGGSMRPVLREGQEVWLRPLARGEDLRGAVIAFQARGQNQEGHEPVVVHRVLEQYGDQLQTTGVARTLIDQSVPRSAVIGVVTRRRGHLELEDWQLRSAARLCGGVLRAVRSLR